MRQTEPYQLEQGHVTGVMMVAIESYYKGVEWVKKEVDICMKNALIS